MPTSDEIRFGVLILTHGRPDRVHTLSSLRRSNYTGPWWLVIDNEDATGEKYRELYGADRVIEFDKKAISETFDTADLSDVRKSIVYARNAAFVIAEELGLTHFMELDDDYTSFAHRYLEGDQLVSRQVQDFDRVVDLMLEFLQVTGAATVAMAQGGDYMGGSKSTQVRAGLLRKAMNSLVISTTDSLRFVGRINEDVNTYVTEGSRGRLFLTIMALQLTQIQTQANAGGMSDLYLDSGTYVKSFYTVMMHPSSVRVRLMGNKSLRMHHAIQWEYTVPKILSSTHQKRRPADA